MNKDKNENEVKRILSKLLGQENVPDDCVLKAILNDQRLQKLAEYDITKGYTHLKVEAEQFQAKFAELKQAVLTKSSTLAELETMVFSRYGVLERQRIDAQQTETMLQDLKGMEFAEKKPVVTGFTPPTPEKKQTKERK